MVVLLMGLDNRRSYANTTNYTNYDSQSISSTVVPSTDFFSAISLISASRSSFVSVFFFAGITSSFLFFSSSSTPYFIKMYSSCRFIQMFICRWEILFPNFIRRINFIFFFLVAKYSSKWAEFECGTFLTSDRNGDGTDCHEVHPLI